VFTEVLEHLHYYYVPLVLSKIIRTLKPGGVLILTMPSIASLFKRLRLLLGVQPIYQYHVREYTVREVALLPREAGFEVIKVYYSIVNDLT
jgi:predicted SAM-dependent methyltransferase